MIVKNINGLQYWKIKNTIINSDIIEVYLYGYLTEDSDNHFNMFKIDIPTSIINNLTLVDYNSTIEILENWIKSNVQEFLNE